MLTTNAIGSNVKSPLSGLMLCHAYWLPTRRHFGPFDYLTMWPRALGPSRLNGITTPLQHWEHCRRRTGKLEKAPSLQASYQDLLMTDGNDS